METDLRDEFDEEVTESLMSMLRMPGRSVNLILIFYEAKQSNSLNTHDPSAMREIIGMSKSVLSACLGLPEVYSALFQYDGFAVTFESGINAVPAFDARIEVYRQDKIVRVDYNTPFVKGLPVIMTVREKIESRPGQNSYGFSERVVRRTYEDLYTLEMLEFFECVVNAKQIKTSVENSIK